VGVNVRSATANLADFYSDALSVLTTSRLNLHEVSSSSALSKSVSHIRRMLCQFLSKGYSICWHSRSSSEHVTKQTLNMHVFAHSVCIPCEFIRPAFKVKFIASSVMSEICSQVSKEIVVAAFVIYY
jgi:hypothetical protein